MMSEWPQSSQSPTAPPPPPPQGQGVPAATVSDATGVGGSSGGRNLQLDLYHFTRTLPGIMKLVEILFGIICIACAAPARLGGTDWFLFVTVTSLLLTLLWLVVYLFIIKEIIRIPWAIIEFACLVGISVLYFIAFVVQLAIWSPYSANSSIRNANIAAGCFGLFNFIVYSGHTYLVFADWRMQPRV